MVRLSGRDLFPVDHVDDLYRDISGGRVVIAIALVHDRPELQEEQVESFRRFAGIPLTFAGTSDAIADVDIRVDHCPFGKYIRLLFNVGQILDRFPEDDVLVIEDDMKLIAPVDFQSWPGYVVRRWSSFAWPGITFRRSGRQVRRYWEQIGTILSAVNIAKTIDDFDHLLPFVRLDTGDEVIGEVFLHATASAKKGHKIAVDPEAKSRQESCSKCDATIVECYMKGLKICSRRRIWKSGSRPCPRGKW